MNERSTWFDAGTSGGGVADVSAVLDPAALDAIVRLVGRGALVSVGTTRDGGAVGVTVTYDGQWRREYFRDAVPLSEFLGGAEDQLDAWGLAGGSPPAASQRPGRRAQKARRGAAGG